MFVAVERGGIHTIDLTWQAQTANLMVIIRQYPTIRCPNVYQVLAQIINNSENNCGCIKANCAALGLLPRWRVKGAQFECKEPHEMSCGFVAKANHSLH